MQKIPKRNKIDVQVNAWTIKKERLLRYWQEECRLYNWLYIQTVESYQLYNKVFSLTSIILSSVTGTTLLNQSNENSASNGRILIAFGIISLLAGMVSSVKEFMDFGAKINANINCARQNSCIVNDIDEQLNMERVDRTNGREFMKSIKDRKNDLIQNGPMIPKSKWSKLQKQINSGQGINFFNKKLFQEYMEQTINVGDIDFHMPCDDGSPDSPRARIQQRVAVPDENTLTFMQQITLDDTITASERPTTPTNATHVPTPPPMFQHRTLTVTSTDTSAAHIDTINTNAASEDEYIANMNDENLCAGTLRQMLEEPEQLEPPVTPRRLFRFKSRGKRSVPMNAVAVSSHKSRDSEAQDGYRSDPDLELGRPKSGPLTYVADSSNTSKYNPLLQYQLTRL